MSSKFTESTVEEAALEWFDGLGYEIAHGPEIAPGEPAARRTGHTMRPFAHEEQDTQRGLLHGR